MTDFPGWKQFGWNPPAFDPQWFREQNYGQGHRLRWQKAMKCPCVKTIHPEGDPLGTTYETAVKEGRDDCPDCYGRGILYFGEQEIVAPVHGFSLTPRWLQLFGSIADGGCLISPEPEHLLNRRDRISDLDEVRLYDEVCVRTGSVETPNTARGTPTYPIVVENITVGGEPDPRIPATAVRGVIYIRRADSQGRIQPTPLVYGTDFTVNDDGAIEWIDAGVAASGYVSVSTDANLAGTMIPEGSRMLLAGYPLFYATSSGINFSPANNSVAFATVTAQASAVGPEFNFPVGTQLGPLTLVLPDETEYECVVTIVTGFDQGASPGEGGNVPAIGERYALQYVCRPTYIVRMLSQAGRSARVSNEPYINMIDGYQGFWSPSEGSFPSGGRYGDYWEISADGTLDEVEFSQGDYLVALVEDPSTETYAGNWRHLPVFGGDDGDDTSVEHMPTAALCWLEDMGDPFMQGGVA